MRKGSCGIGAADLFGDIDFPGVGDGDVANLFGDIDFSAELRPELVASPNMFAKWIF